MKIYIEHSALNSEIKKLEKAGKIKLCHNPYDLDSKSKKLPNRAEFSEAMLCDLNMPMSEWPELKKHKGSEHFETILDLIGKENRKDALHIDSAYKTNCSAMITRDSDIMDKAEKLTELLGIQFFHADDDSTEFIEFVKEKEL